jgi:hypothetical protein
VVPMTDEPRKLRRFSIPLAVVPLLMFFPRWFGIAPIPAHAVPVTVCGIQLHPRVDKLKERVERLYGMPLDCELGDIHAGEMADFGTSRIATDDTPVIILDRVLGTDETEIAHELYHLKLIAEGIDGGLETHAPPDIDAKTFQYTVRKLHNIIAHRLFYPKMRSMSLDPNKKQRDGMMQIISKSSKYDRIPSFDEATLDYVVLIAADDTSWFQQEVDSYFDRLGLAPVAQRGKLIIQTMDRFQPGTLQEMKADILACIDAFYARSFSYDSVTLLKWTPSHKD